MTGPAILTRYDPLRIAGDYDASGGVDQGDLDLVLLNWGADTLPRTWLHDLADLPIDQSELDKVLLRWGRSDGIVAVDSGVGQASVTPEPTTAGILAVLIASSVALKAMRQ